MDWEAFYNNFRKPGFISGYEIQNRLGGGAFGDVYKASKQSIGKSYAIKFLKIEDDSQRQAVQRELSQVRHFAAIDHPNLVSIEDMGTVMEVPFLIMGYAGEDTLARRLKHGPLNAEAALLYFVQACRGVLALHDRQLVHFDLKPSNIFLKGDVARVGDYGLSKLLTDGRTTLSYGRGTPQYMAPEMLRNRADHRADIYSLGVILYEALTAELPFEGETPGGLVIRETDVPPTFPADFPALLRLAVERCLRLDPADRFGSVEELLFEIEQTARPGDSVRLTIGDEAADLGEGAAGPGAAGGASSSGATSAAGAPASTDTAAAGSAARARSLTEELAAARAKAREAAASPIDEGSGGAGRGPAGRLRDDRGALRDSRLEPSTPTPSLDLRQTSTELALGAARVVRSVWDGLVHGSEGGGRAAAGEASAPTEPSTGSSERLEDEESDTVTALRRVQSRLRKDGSSGARDSAAAERESAAASDPLATGETPLGQPGGDGSSSKASAASSSTGPRSDGALAGRSDFTGGSGTRLAGAAGGPGARLDASGTASRHDASWLGARAVPVPPRVEGGIVGTLFSTVVLALEILAALVGSLLRGAATGIRLGGDRLMRTSGGLASKTLRLALFLFVMALAGALVMTAGMLFIGATGAG